MKYKIAELNDADKISKTIENGKIIEVGYHNHEETSGNFMRLNGTVLSIVILKFGKERFKIIDRNFDTKYQIPNVNDYSHLFRDIFPNRKERRKRKEVI